jgi:hypothetical protein
VENVKDKDRFKDIGVYGRIMFKWIFLDGCGLDASGSGWGTFAGSCIHGNEPSDSKKFGEFLNYVTNL